MPSQVVLPAGGAAAGFPMLLPTRHILAANNAYPIRRLCSLYSFYPNYSFEYRPSSAPIWAFSCDGGAAAWERIPSGSLEAQNNVLQIQNENAPNKRVGATGGTNPRWLILLKTMYLLSCLTGYCLTVMQCVFSLLIASNIRIATNMHISIDIRIATNKCII